MTIPHAFISYSHVDAEYVDRFRIHIKPIERLYKFEIWDDTRIKPGQKWKDQIRDKLTSASVVVLFLSADFFASDYVMDHEYPEALQKAHDNGVQIVAIFVSPCMYEDFEIADFQAVNPPSETLQDFQTDNAKQERIFVKAAKYVKEYLSTAASKSGTIP